MKVIVKKLQGVECSLDVQPSTVISDMKKEISMKLGIPVEEQKLLLLGRTLADDQTVQFYKSIKDGTKLNLVVKKPEGFVEVSTRYFKRLGMQDVDATNAANRLLKVVDDKFSRMSWDDIERLAGDCLARLEAPVDSESAYGL